MTAPGAGAAAFAAAGLCDLSDWAKFRFTGPDRRKFLNGLLTNDILRLGAWRGLEACLLSPKGQLRAHLELYDRGEDLLALCRPACAKNLREGLSKVIMLSETRLEDASAELGLLYLAGPAAGRALAAALGQEPPAPGVVRAAAFEGGDLTLIGHSRLRRDGALIVCPRAACAALSGALERAGAARVGPEGLEALRVESGLPAFGVDIGEDTLPQEARLEAAISFDKGCYLGQETVSRLHHRGHVNRLLAGLRFAGVEPPAGGAAVLAGGKEAGTVTSAAYSPRLSCALALAMLKAEAAEPGTRVEAGGRPATVIALPVEPAGP